MSQPITIEQLNARILAEAQREASKHRPECASLSDPDGRCRCEVDGVFMWCTVCGYKVSAAEADGLRGCPSCGSTGVPCSAIDDVQIGINWHELRILVMWAEGRAADCDERPKSPYEREKVLMMPVVRAIARRIQEQHPSRSPLMLSGDLAKIKEAFPDAEVHGNIQPDAASLPPKVN